MYTIFNIKFDIPKQIFFLSYNNDENRDLKKYLSRSSFRLEKQKYFLNKKKNKLILICLTLQNPFQVAISLSWEFFCPHFFHNHKLLS